MFRFLISLLFFLSASMLMAETATRNDPPSAAADELPPLPEAIASFGAALDGDRLYVAGGHTGKQHEHSLENVSRRFLRLDLASPGSVWEDLGEFPGIQGFALVAHRGQICRAGGLVPRNHRGEKEDLFSSAEVACYDPAKKSWRQLPPLPRPRSSHDAVIAGDQLIVAGGWELRGADQTSVWHDTIALLDLAAESPSWRELPQPFRRRALAVVAAAGKVYALGGMSEAGMSREADVYDLAAGTWSKGPELPTASSLKGFGVAALSLGERVVLSGFDGTIHTLADGVWSAELGQLRAPRFFHRMVVHGGELLFIAGANRDGHLSDIEKISLATRQSAAVAPIDRGRWPGFRGEGDSRLGSEEAPLHWSAEEGVAWRAALPGYGQSAPVVWGGQVFVTSVEGARKETLILSAFDLESGEVRWRRRFAATLEIESTDMVSRGAPTPVADERGVYAFWESGDLVAVDHQGETLWQRALGTEYGRFEGNHGLGSSPVLAGEAVVVQVTHAGPSYLLAVDRKTGANLWKADRPAKVAWTTPVAVRGERGLELLVSVEGRVEALDAASGESLWRFAGTEGNSVPSAAAAGELVIVASSKVGSNLALRRGGAGEVGEERVAWRGEGLSSGFGSPLVHGGCVFFVNKAGAATCLDLTTGAERWTGRLADACWASPVAAGENVFFFTKKGTTQVFRHPEGGEPVLVAENQLPTEDVVYGVAAVRGAFLVRTGRELIRVGT